MIWHIYSHLYCSSRDGGRDLPSSGEAVPTMGQVSCEFWVDRPNFILQPAAPDMIWHIYSGQHCFKDVLCMDLLSSGDVALTIGQVSCAFWDWSTFIFQPAAPNMIWHIYSHLYCSLRDGGRDLPSSGEPVPTMGQVPCEFRVDWPNFIFQLAAPDMIWHIYSGQHCFKDVLCMDLLSSWDVALTMGQVPCSFRGDWPTFIFQPAAPDMIWHIYSSQRCFKGVLGMDLPSSGDVAPQYRAGPLWVLSRSANLHFSASSSWCDLTHLLAPVLLLEGWW